MLNQSADVEPAFSCHAHLFTSLRHRVLNVLDLQFILVTGRDRNHCAITLGEIVNLQDLYRYDAEALLYLWGCHTQMLEPLKMAMDKVDQIDIDIQEHRRSPHDLVSDFATEQPEFVLTLGTKIVYAMKLGLLGEPFHEQKHSIS